MLRRKAYERLLEWKSRVERNHYFDSKKQTALNRVCAVEQWKIDDAIPKDMKFTVEISQL